MIVSGLTGHCVWELRASYFNLHLLILKCSAGSTTSFLQDYHNGKTPLICFKNEAFVRIQFNFFLVRAVTQLRIQPIFPLIIGMSSISEMDSVRILLYSLIFLLSVFGNLLIIVVLVVNKRMRTVTNSFLLSLAVSDLMMAVFCMPFTFIPNLLEDFIFGAAMCKIVAYLMGRHSSYSSY